jgi:hypothetical protein
VPIIDGDVEERFAVCLHEIGHILAEPCSGGDHKPDPSESRWHACLRCETLAWSHAMRIWPFSRGMFARLQSSLGIYRHSTPGPVSAVAALDRQRGTLAWAEHRQAIAMRSIDVKSAQLAWARLSPSARVDRQWADLVARRGQMRKGNR